MSVLPFWEGFRVDSCVEREDSSLLISLTESDSAPICGACHQPCSLVHERCRRIVRDRDCFDRKVWLDVPIRRMDCHHCGARVAEHISWFDRRSRITHRLRNWVEVLVQILPIKHVAKLTELHWHTIKTIDYQRRNGETHWNGSTAGVDPIKTQNIPVEIRRIFGVK